MSGLTPPPAPGALCQTTPATPPPPPPLGLLATGIYLGVVLIEALLVGFAAIAFYVAAPGWFGHLRVNMVSIDKDGDFIAVYLILYFLLVMATTAFFLAVRRGESPLSQLAVRRPPLKQVMLWVGAVIVLAPISDEVFRLLDIDPMPPWMVSVYQSADHLPLFMAAVVLIAPLTEETIFRGLVFGGVERRLGPAVAVIVATIPWALMHSGQYQPAFIILVGILGVLLGCARHYSKSLFVPLLMHSLNNLLAMLQVSSG